MDKFKNKKKTNWAKWKKIRYVRYKTKYDISEPNDLSLLKAMVELEAQLELNLKQIRQATKKDQIAERNILNLSSRLTEEISKLQYRLGINRKDRLDKQEEFSGSSIAEVAMKFDKFIEDNPNIVQEWKKREKALLKRLGDLSYRKEFAEKLKGEEVHHLLDDKEEDSK